MSLTGNHIAYKFTSCLVILLITAGLLPKLSAADCSGGNTVENIIKDEAVPLICDTTDILLCDLTENHESGCLKQTFAVFTFEKKPKLPVLDYYSAISASNIIVTAVSSHLTTKSLLVNDTGPSIGFLLRAPPAMA